MLQVRKESFGSTQDRFADTQAKLSGLEGRGAGLPMIWAMVGIVGAFVIGIATVGFGVAKLMEKPAAVQPVSPVPPVRSP